MWFIDTCRDLFNIIENFCKKYFPYILMAALCAFACICVYKVYYDVGSLDEIEHIHVSYLISIGQIPYKDFFEHHHPLMWYLFIPIIKLFFNSLNIIYFTRFLALLGYFCCFYLIYKINAKFLFGKKVALLSTFFLVFIPDVWWDIISIRPDIFMNIFCLLAIYYNMAYLQNKRTSNLMVSYLCMIISFLFLQKVAIIGVGFAIANLWFIYKSEIRWRDFLISAIVASVPLLLFALYLYYYNIFPEYFYYNYTYNAYVVDYYDDFTLINKYIRIMFWLCIGSAFFKYKYNPSTFLLLMCCLFTFISILKFSPFIQYSPPFLILVSPFCGNFIANILSHKKIYCLIYISIFYRLYNLPPSLINRQNFQQIMGTMEFIKNNVDFSDKFINFSDRPYNVYTKDADYYWFGFDYGVIIDILYNPAIKNYNFQELIIKFTPEYLIYEPPIDQITAHNFRKIARRNQLLLKRAVIDNGNQKFVAKLATPISDFWQIDEKWLNQHYEQTQYEYIWKKKQPANKEE